MTMHYGDVIAEQNETSRAAGMLRENVETLQYAEFNYDTIHGPYCDGHMEFVLDNNDSITELIPFNDANYGDDYRCIRCTRLA